MNKKLTAILTSVMMLTTGCATQSNDIAGTYISPLIYNNYDCDQIAAEMSRIQVRVTQLGGRLDNAASNDKAIMAVGIVIFWPALFALGGNKEKEAEFARLKGELDAIQQAQITKRCLTRNVTELPSNTPGGTISKAAGAGT